MTVNTAILETIVQGAPQGSPDLDSYPAAMYGAPLATVPDSLGYGNRECGSYAAHMAAAAGQNMPPYSVMGTAGYWPQHVDPSWIVTVPQPGDIGIVPVLLPWFSGHAMYIDWVQPGGNLVVKSYNEDLAGDFALQVWAPSGIKSGIYGGVPYSLPFALVYLRFPAV